MNQIYKLLLTQINSKNNLVENWFDEQFSKHKPLFYNSVDLRHSSFKIAPIDTNCFPAGFNHLNLESRQKAKLVVENFLKNNFPGAKKILIIPENHTRNLKYLENVLALYEIISEVVEVELGSLIPELEGDLTIDLENGKKIILKKIIRNNDQVLVQNFIPDLIISNNDFTDGLPEILADISQAIVPSTSLGWYQRTKSVHFNIYNKLADELAQILEIDPWLISALHYTCEEVNFKEMTGLECLTSQVDKLIAQIKAKYQQYQIDAEPYCFIKADSGTYGLAMMTVKSGQDVIEINKKERNKMNMLKGNVRNTHVIIQEGVITNDLIKNMIAEPMIYLINGHVVGNLFRVNETRDNEISLNAAGMSFYDINNLSDAELSLGLPKNEVIKIYSIIARLAALAAACEEY